MSNIEERLTQIEERNNRVEMDKAWEVSWFRRFLIIAITYVIVALFLSRVHPENMWLDAIIPCCGYLLSTLSLPSMKKMWVQCQSKNKEV